MNTLSLEQVKQKYFDKLIVSRSNAQLSSALKAKVLLVDHHTMPIISMSYTQSQLLQHDVVLIEMLENYRNLAVMKHLNCAVFIKPVKESVVMLANELASPHYSNYQVFFNNAATKGDIERLADADEHEVVCHVAELFQDYSIATDNLFVVDLPPPAPVPQTSKNALTIHESNSVSSLLLSLRKCPVIKYEQGSLESKRLASELLYTINSNSNNNLYDDVQMKGDVPPVLLIIDRKNDPITPLVLPWTYQSMIHELIGIHRNVVAVGGDDKKTTGSSDEHVTLSADQDQFFSELMYLNYGDLTDKFQHFVDDYKKQTKQSSIENLKTQDLSELKRLLTRFPEFKKLSNNILKHLNIISEIDHQISAHNLWAVGELQQTITCDLENHATIKSRLIDLIADPTVSTENKVKLLILYVAKFPGNKTDLGGMLAKLNDPVTTKPPPTVSQMALINHFSTYFGSVRTMASNHDNNANNNIGGIFNKNRIKIQQLFNASQDDGSSAVPKTDNIFMQYIPKLNSILTHVTSPPHTRPNNMATTAQGAQPDLTTLVPDIVSTQYGDVTAMAAQEVIVYFKGGATYEEARLVHDLHKVNNKINYVIGGDGILNSHQWLEKMCDVVNGGESNQAQPDRSLLRELL